MQGEPVDKVRHCFFGGGMSDPIDIQWATGNGLVHQGILENKADRVRMRLFDLSGELSPGDAIISVEILASYFAKVAADPDIIPEAGRTP